MLPLSFSVSFLLYDKKGGRERERHRQRQNRQTGRGMNKGIGTDRKTDRETDRQRRTVRIHTQRIMNDTCTYVHVQCSFLHIFYINIHVYTLVPWTHTPLKTTLFSSFLHLMVVLARLPSGGPQYCGPRGGSISGGHCQVETACQDKSSLSLSPCGRSERYWVYASCVQREFV